MGKRKETCPACLGTKETIIPGTKYDWTECSNCKGKGYLLVDMHDYSVGEIKPVLGKSGVFDSGLETMVVAFGDFDVDALSRISREFQPRYLLILSKKLSFSQNNDFWFVIETAKKFEDGKNILVVSGDKDFLEFVVSTNTELLDTKAGFFTGVTYNFTDGVDEYNSKTGIYKNGR